MRRYIYLSIFYYLLYTYAMSTMNRLNRGLKSLASVSVLLVEGWRWEGSSII